MITANKKLLSFCAATVVVICLLLKLPYAAATSYTTCPYIMKDGKDSYYDFSKMYTDADIAVIASVASIPPQIPEQGLMTLQIQTVLKGDQQIGSLLVPYTRGNCNRTNCNGDIITPTARHYLFFLRRTSPSTAVRILCPYQVSNGWVANNELHFSETYSVPLNLLKGFLESNKAVVPAP